MNGSYGYTGAGCLPTGYWWTPSDHTNPDNWLIAQPGMVYVPSKFERQRERFRDQLAMRRGRLLALEVQEMLS